MGERIGVLKLGGIGDMCDTISLIRSIQNRRPDATVSLITDCKPMLPILESHVDSVRFDMRPWKTIFRSEAWKFNRFYDFRPHQGFEFTADFYTRRMSICWHTACPDMRRSLAKRWKHYNSWETHRLQSLGKSVVELNIESCGLEPVPYQVNTPDLPQVHTPPPVTIHIGAGGGSRRKQTKQGDPEFWQQVVDELRDVDVVQIGRKWEYKLRRVEHEWNHSLLHTAALLKSSRVHIGPENGMVRLRSLFTTKPSVVLFGPTHPDMYGFPQNTNLWRNVCAPCLWYTGEWMWECPMEWDTVCMKSFDPASVAEEVRTCM